MEELYKIQYVAKAADLSPYVIRAWERRYGAINPARTDSGQRLYSAADIERLKLLKAVTDSGHAISQVAGLDTDALRRAVSDTIPPPPPPLPHGPAGLVAEGLDAVVWYDGPGLQHILDRAAVELSQTVLLEQVVLPLMHHVGERWRAGQLRPAQEHLASAEVRGLLARLMNRARSVQIGATGPLIVVTTPAGQLHEIGGQIIALTALSAGWRTLYLGPNLPAEDIAAAAKQAGARAVALSVVYPMADPVTAAELERLAGYLPCGVMLYIGGRAARSYVEALAGTNAVFPESLDEFRRSLEQPPPMNSAQLGSSPAHSP